MVKNTAKVSSHMWIMKRKKLPPCMMVIFPKDKSKAKAKCFGSLMIAFTKANLRII